MDPIPIEEAWLRPIVSWALSCLTPIAMHRALAKSSSAWLVEPAAMALAWFLGRTALGPYWTDTPNGFAHHLAAIFCVLAAFVASRMSRRSIEKPEAPPEISTHSNRWPGIIIVAILILGIAIVRFTRIDSSEIPYADQSAITWRLRIDPWDNHAWLAAAWAARERNDLALARAQLELAIELGAPLPESLELESELHAASGNCTLARERFEESLSARAARAFETSSELELGGWHLPRTLVSRCGYGAR